MDTAGASDHPAKSQQRPSRRPLAIEHVFQHAGDMRDVVGYRKLTILARHPAGNDSFDRRS